MNANQNATFLQSEDERQNPPDASLAAATYYYYAVLNGADIVTEVISTPFPAPPEYTEYIQIESLDQSLVGKWYNRQTGTFEEALPIVCDANNVTYNNDAGYRLPAKIADMDTEIADNTAQRHTHSNMAVLEVITPERMAAWDNGSGGGVQIDAYTKLESDERFAAYGTSYTKAESDEKYALAGQGGGSGQDGITPHIGPNGNWFIGEADTGVRAEGPEGPQGQQGEPGTGGAEITPNDLLVKIKTVDGTNSGLDADTVDGYHASDFAKTAHQHLLSEMNGTLPLSKGGTGATNASSALSALGAAPSNHSHTPSSIGAASATHTHTPASIGAASSSHTHSEYAPYSHTHSSFDGPTTFNDEVGVNGIFRVRGQQMVYCTGSNSTLSSNNVVTNIAGSEIWSKVAIKTSSDERLKKNIGSVDEDALRDFIGGIEVKEYNLKEDEVGAEKKLGVIAQQLVNIDPEIAKYFVSEIKEDGMLAVCYQNLVLPLILCVQDLTERINELEDK